MKSLIFLLKMGNNNSPQPYTVKILLHSWWVMETRQLRVSRRCFHRHQQKILLLQRSPFHLKKPMKKQGMSKWPGLCILDLNSMTQKSNTRSRAKNLTSFVKFTRGKRGAYLSNKLTKVIEAPELYALPVRPIRCMYPATLRGISKFITCSSPRESIK